MSSLRAGEIVGSSADQGKAETFKIGICYFSTKHAALKEKEQRLIGLESE